MNVRPSYGEQETDTAMYRGIFIGDHDRRDMVDGRAWVMPQDIVQMSEVETMSPDIVSKHNAELRICRKQRR
jgi:hypothetical protein